MGWLLLGHCNVEQDLDNSLRDQKRHQAAHLTAFVQQDIYSFVSAISAIGNAIVNEQATRQPFSTLAIPRPRVGHQSCLSDLELLMADLWWNSETSALQRPDTYTCNLANELATT